MLRNVEGLALIDFQCPSCGRGYSVADEDGGRKTRCRCGVAFRVPLLEGVRTAPKANPYVLPDELKLALQGVGVASAALLGVGLFCPVLQAPGQSVSYLEYMKGWWLIMFALAQLAFILAMVRQFILMAIPAVLLSSWLVMHVVIFWLEAENSRVPGTHIGWGFGVFGLAALLMWLPCVVASMKGKVF